MRISLDVVSDGGVLTGTAQWSEGSPRHFHGALELLAFLEAALLHEPEAHSTSEDVQR